MITHFLEASDNLAYGKFMLARLDGDEINAPSALPGYEGSSLLRLGGLRRFNERSTLIVDLQTGNAAVFFISDGGDWKADLNRTGPIHVCPMFRPMLKWLYEQKVPAHPPAAIQQLPHFVEIDNASTG